MPFKNNKEYIGVRQSTLMLHHFGLGIAYSNASQWWGPGMHSSIALSSNAPGVPHYSIGTYPEIKYNRLGMGFKVVLAEYENSVGTPIYFTGLSAHSTYYSNPTITIGFFRTYMSGNFSNLIDDTSLKTDWTLIDASKLLIEPLFGQSKSGLAYTTPGTPGFDKWDELLSAYVNITFPKELLKIYFELASDDNRGNYNDLRAHWDHTLGYIIGFRKYYKFRETKLFVGAELISTKISNTYNSKFWRGYPNKDNYYTREYYDYFSFKGRMMGAHSGASSDDQIITVGYNKGKGMLLVYINRERHGVKSMKHHERKSEFNIYYNYKINRNSTVFVNLEFEKIQNFSFNNGQDSASKFLWIGYSFSIN